MIGTSLDRHAPGLPSRRIARFWTVILVLTTSLLAAASGDLDVTFGDSGVLNFSIGDYGSCGTDLLQQDSGKLVFAGLGARTGSDQDFVVTRYDVLGALDATFGDAGVAGADFNGLNDFGYAALELADGKLLLVGITDVVELHSDIGLARFSAEGTPDDSFGTDGVVRLNAGGNYEYARDVVQQADGKLVVAGATDATGVSQVVLARVTTEGDLDATFGTDGFVLLDFGAGTISLASTLLQQADGKLVVAGNVYDANGQNSDIALARLTAEGQLDASFDADGLLVVDVGGEDGAYSTALQSNGSIVVAGYTAHESVTSAALIRVQDDGSVDPTFGSGVESSPVLMSVVAEPDDSLLALANDGSDVMVVRFTASGAFDTDYGVDGLAIVDFGEGNIAPFAQGTALFRQDDGRVVLLACDSRGGFAVARIDDAGTSPGRLGLKLTEQLVSENDASVSYVVRRTGGTSGSASVAYETTAGTADASNDFTTTAGTLTWNDGDATTHTIVVPIVDDSDPESSEDFLLTLSNPSGAVLAASDATTTITSEDGPGEFSFIDGLTPRRLPESDETWTVSVRRIDGSEGAVTVDYATQGGSATAGSDFTATSGTLSWGDGDTDLKPILLEILDDQITEGDEDFQIRLSNPTGGATLTMLRDVQLLSIVANDNGEGAGVVAFSGAAAASVAEGDSLSLTVARTDGATGAISVDYATSADSATAGADFETAQGTLTWANGDVSAKTITIDTLDDSAAEANETLDVSLSNAGGGASLGSQAMRTVTITDDDSDGGGGNGGGGGGGGGYGHSLTLLALFVLAWRRVLCRACVAALLLLLANGPVRAADALTMTGEQLYSRYCAACHGANGEGDGPVTPSLAVRVPDLTQIAHRQGGTFKRGSVEGMIDGRAQVAAHGSREMPVWGEELWKLDIGNPDSESVTRTVIGRLVDYIESLQRPVESDPEGEGHAGSK